MMTFQQTKAEFIAKTITDLGKAIFIVGLTSYFFEKFDVIWRIVISIISAALILAGFFIYPTSKEGD